MSEKGPKSPQAGEASYRADLHATSTTELLSKVEDLAGDRFSVTANDRLQLKAGTTSIDDNGNVKKVGGRFESKHQLEDIAAFEDQIRLGMKAKEIASASPAVEAALQSAREQAALMNESQKTTLKEVGVMRHALVESKALSALEVGNMSDEDVETLVTYMRLENNPGNIILDTTSSPANAETQTASRQFTVGESVTVQRSSGTVEDGWYILRKYEDDNKDVFVVAKDLEGDEDGRIVKDVPADRLAEWNPVVEDTPDTGIISVDIPASGVGIQDMFADTNGFTINSSIIDTKVSEPDQDRTSWLPVDAPAQPAVRLDSPVGNDTAPDSDVRRELTPIDAPASDAVIGGEVVSSQNNPDMARATDAPTNNEGLLSKIKNIPAYLTWKKSLLDTFMREKRAMSTADRLDKRGRYLTRALGAASVGLLVYLAYEGLDTSSANEVATSGNSLDTPLQDVTGPQLPEPGSSTEHGVTMDAAGGAEQFSSEVLTAHKGEGWDNQLLQMGVPTEELSYVKEKLLTTTDSSIREWVYTMDNGDPGIAKPGQFSPDVLQSIQKLRQQ